MLTKTAVKRIFKGLKVYYKTSKDRIYYDNNCILTDNYISKKQKVESSVIDPTIIIICPYKSTSLDVILEDYKGTKHRVFVSFCDTGFEYYIIKERYYELIKGRPLLYGSTIKGKGRIATLLRDISIRTTTINLKTIVETTTQFKLFGDQQANIEYNY